MTTPNLLAAHVSGLGAILIGAALFLAVTNDRGLIFWSRGSLAILAFTTATTIWLAYTDSVSSRNVAFTLTDGAILFVCVVSSAIVLADERRLRAFVRGFVGAVLLIGASYVVTFAIWAIAGPATNAIAQVPVGTWIAMIYFPMTPTTGTQTFFGITLPRLAGFGREPGWMAMWAGVAWFLLPRAYHRVPWWMRALVLVAILAPISTGGFAVFVVALAYEVFIKRRDGLHPLTNFLVRMMGVVFAACATWFAFNAPVLGINAKEEMNAASLDERSRVTQYGLDALSHFSLGGSVTYPNSSLNLIAAIAPNGWPYPVLVLASLLLARVAYPGVEKTTAAIGVVTLTLLFSQPTGASSAVFIVVVAIYAAYAPPRRSQALRSRHG